MKESPGWLRRDVMVSVTATSRCVPDATVSVAGGAGLVGGFAGGRVAGALDGTGMSLIAPEESLGASVRLRAVESAGWLLARSLLAQAPNTTAQVTAAVSGWNGRRIIGSLPKEDRVCFKR
jgi:hypothetical protein